MIRRHPHKFAIAAWFDGEGSESVGGHVARCGRCRRHAAELARVRSWLRAQPFVAMTDDVDEPGRSKHRWRPVMVVALLLFAYLIAPSRDDGNLGRSPRGPMGALGGGGPESGSPPPPAADEPGDPGASGTPEGDAPAPPAATRSASGPTADNEVAAGVVRRSAANSPLTLGLIVPTSGPLGREGVEVREVVQRRVQAANASGGVAGLPVELVVASAEDPKAIGAMAGAVDAIVGGFGADVTTATPWIFPADPLVAGTNVVPAEAPARAVGAQLAAELRDQGPFGLVGVVVGTGPDSAMAAGLASKASVTTVTAKKNTSCLGEIATLRRSGAMILAVAGDSDLAANCIRAAARSPWHARLGPLVAPSAAYAGVASLPEATGARTVLALPWPTSSAPGAARFRATTSSESYRALVSYAATELAIDVARQTGTVSPASMAGRTWHSDLVELNGVVNRPGSIASALFGAWIASP
ncbi:MAG TPA: ABC transporter substrate-binding protein [Acidimicrobiales bacterium]|nr:ABC transporter substrate-binding protein [Acidimicrobiales bacterium]